MAKSSLNSAAKIAIQLQQLSNEATEKSFQYNAQEASNARAWQKEMSDTSHQREVQDLIKAGLNPVLSSGGSGAQSYTTSSASAQAENAAGAVANIYGSQMSADATRAAAAASAKATRYAAAQQAAAARYAASMQYAASVYHSDKALEAKKYATDHSKSGTPSGILSNILNQAMNDPASAKIGNKQLVSMNKILKNPTSYLKDANKPFSVNNLNQKGLVAVNRAIKSYGIENSGYLRKVYINAFLNHKKSYMNKWIAIINKNNMMKRNAANRLASWKGYL